MSDSLVVADMPIIEYRAKREKLQGEERNGLVAVSLDFLMEIMFGYV